MDAIFPRYGFSSHVGYITPGHTLAVRAHGPCEQHRRSWNLLGEDPEQRLERIAALGVPHAMDRRQQGVQPIDARIRGAFGNRRGRGGHRGRRHGSWFKMRVSGTAEVKMTSSAGRS